MLTSGLRRLTFLLALACALWLMHPASAGAVDDPDLDFQTLETPHFYVHYYDEVEALAHRAARTAEEAHRLLVPLLGLDPAGKTHIVINDRVDTANGSANTLGRNVIRIYGMPPNPDGVLGYYDDWLRILMYHEYVHILHLETSGGLIPYLNLFLGNLLHPNAALPRWYVEGLAVVHESNRTGTGRNNSSLFRMYLRTAALEGTFFDLGTTTGNPTSWPQGTTPYLYGGYFMDYVIDKHGENFPNRFNHRYGSRLIPFALNAISEDITGQTFHDMWQEFRAHMAAEAEARRVAVEAAGRTQLQQITDGGNTHRYPRVRPGTDQMTFYANGLQSHGMFAATPFRGGGETDGKPPPVRQLFEIEGAPGPADWTPDGRAMLYSRGTYQKNVYVYQDLYAWRPDTGDHRQLTSGERAREPAISPDGKRVAYVRNRAGTMDLVVCRLVRLTLRDCRVVVGGSKVDDTEDRHWQQIAGPRWTPDGAGVVFSWWRLDLRQRDLWLWRPDGLERLTDDAAQDIDPHFGPDGLLYFSSDRTGIYNIYARELGPEGRRTDGRTWQASNVVRGLFSPWVSPDGRWIYAAGYTAEGYELVRFERPDTLDRPAPDSYAGPLRRRYPDVDTRRWTRRNYQPLRWLQPLTLEPNLGAFTSGAGAGATLSSNEPLGHHRWALSAAWFTGEDPSDHNLSVSANYSYGGGPVNLGVSAGYREYPRTRSLVAESRFVPFLERSYRGALSLNYPLRRIDDSLSLSAAYEVERTSYVQRPPVHHEPADIQPREPTFGWFNELRLGLSYANVDRYRQSISAEKGFFGNLSLRIQNDLLGSDFDQIFLTYAARAYLPNPWVNRHVLALQMDGGIARSNFRQAAFGLGGHRPQDVLRAMIFQQPQGQFVMRGFPPNTLVGNHFQLWTAEYRFPIWRIEAGPSTVPFFLDELKGSVFTDNGAAFNGLLSDAEFRTGIGAELLLSTQVGYYFGGNLRLGFARGLGEDGINEWYFLYGGGF